MDNERRKMPDTHDPVIVHDCLQPVGDGDDCHVTLQFRAQRCLDDGVGLVIYATYSEEKGMKLSANESSELPCPNKKQRDKK